MHTLSYTISPIVQQTLKGMESYRQQICLQPMPLAGDLHRRWEANLNRIYYSLHLAHNPVNKKEIMRALLIPGRRTMQTAERDVVNYKRGIDYIHREWLVNSKPIMPQTIQQLYRAVTDDKTRLPEDRIMEMLVFLQTSHEHPVVQAFISYVQFLLIVPLSDSSGKAARLLPYLFLYKNGLDFRGLLVLEKYFYDHERLLRDLFAAAEKQESISVWVEHFISWLAVHTEETANTIREVHEHPGAEKVWNITERQKEILTTFDQPGIRITNKKVQQAFRISQITASRDLAKLAAVGLLFQYGKGRSVYYTRA